MTQRHRILPNNNKAVEHSYRPNTRHSRSSPRLGDKFLEHNRQSSHYSHEFPHHRRPPRLSSRERRIIHQLRRSPIENNCHSKGGMRRPYSPPRLQHRARYSPARMQRRHRMHSLDRTRRPIERNSLGRGERSNRLPNTQHERKLALGRRDGHRTRKSSGMFNTSGATQIGRSTSNADQHKREEKERKESTGGMEK